MKKVFLGFSAMLCTLVLSGCFGPPRDADNLIIGDWHCGYTRELQEPYSLVLDTSGWGTYEFRKNDEVTVTIDDFRGKGTYSYSNDVVTIEIETGGEIHVEHYWKITNLSEDENKFLAIEEYNGPDKYYTCSREL